MTEDKNLADYQALVGGTIGGFVVTERMEPTNRLRWRKEIYLIERDGRTDTAWRSVLQQLWAEPIAPGPSKTEWRDVPVEAG